MIQQNFNGWHVLQVKTKHEAKVQQEMNRFSLQSFLPLKQVSRQWSDRKKTIVLPLFPSYVFVFLRSLKDFHLALKASGAFNFIRFGQEYARVSVEEINKIRDILLIEDAEDLEVGKRLPRVGDSRQILFGPLKGLFCQILTVSNQHKIRVWLNLSSLKQNITLTLPASYIGEAV
ncbi:antitermination protein NusG [Pedobacter yulinensis]|uniref:Antitermination protein NusG n=1 Tax=Pedobacter yulinensis TaxID=2126353 RepID=A0A2T3HPD0_9SPHI|nr:transcription termination/antitermination NusG family protein [Pedobacter yulinensis]PST84263.1 antitermination protein NusG [Pedobacter yulinensis]